MIRGAHRTDPCQNGVSLPEDHTHVEDQSLRCSRRRSKQSKVLALPIVLVTADGRASEKAQRAGAVAYLHKPFDMAELVRLVGRACSG
jgi:CheY-like chemotaxis protein